MDTDYYALMNLQPELNPGVVLLLGSIAGLLAFAISSSMHVLRTRHRRLRTPAPISRSGRVRNALGAALAFSVLIVVLLDIPGPKLVEGRGWLAGDNLFSVTSRAGFIASYPKEERSVEEGDTILELVRNAGPEEIAAAASRRALLQQDLEFARLEALRVDPLLLAQYTTEKERLDALVERRRRIVDDQESLARGARRQELTDQTRLDEVDKELQSARHELNQTESSFRIASESYAIATRPDTIDLLTADEVHRREERVAVLGSRVEELRDRIAILEREQRQLGELTEASASTDAEHMSSRDQEIERLDREIALGGSQVEGAWQAIEQDKIRAERQREYRLRQIELQIEELDQLLNAREGALAVLAPWGGIVGFREPSPASAALSNRPLLVLYKPGSLTVKLPVTADRTSLNAAEDYGISMRAMIPEAEGSTFAGRLLQSIRLPDGSGELQIVGDPPAAAIRDLATGSSVPVHVVVRRLNPLAAAGLGWYWWLAIALALGVLAGEVHRYRSRRRPGGVGQSDTGAGNKWLGLDWGGNSDEFVEYVPGVGIVTGRIRGGESEEKLEVDIRRRDPAVMVPPKAHAEHAQNKFDQLSA